MFTYGYGRRSSRPRQFTAPNGLNLSRSVTNPNSRFSRMMDYLSFKGEATREEIIRDVFGKTYGVPHSTYKNLVRVKLTPNVVTRGWGAYLFMLSVKYGYVKKVRRGNRVFYSVA
jgi:hypothetical protein